MVSIRLSTLVAEAFLGKTDNSRYTCVPVMPASTLSKSLIVT